MRNLKKIAGTASVLVLTVVMAAQPTSARMIFQSDTFHQIESENILIDSDGTGTENTGIQFGNDSTMSENGVITWDITNNEFDFDHSINVTGGVTASGDVNFSGATSTRLRETADVINGSTACTSVGEIIVDTGEQAIYICTNAGTDTWATLPAANANLLDGLDSTQFLRSDASDTFTGSNLTIGSGSTLDTETGTIVDFSDAGRLAIPSGAADPATCTEGDLFYNTTTNVLKVCTATNTWDAAGPDDFESIYAQDADGTLTTSNGNFSIATGSGEFDVTNTGGIDFNTNTFAFDATSSSNVTVSGNDAGNLTLSLNAANAGAGAGNVAITAEDEVSISSSTWDITGAGVASGFTGLDSTGVVDFSGATSTQLRETATVTDGVTTCTVVGEVIVETTTGKIYTCTDAGTDAWASSGGKSEDLRFYPEYPDTVVFRDGSNNQGTLTATYDGTENSNYYQWTSTQATQQDIDVRFQFALPADFADSNNLTYRYQTGTLTDTDNDVEIEFYNVTDSMTLCASDVQNVSTTWATGTLAEAAIEAGCTGGTALNAGDIVEIRIKLKDNSGGVDFARVGYVDFDYDN